MGNKIKKILLVFAITALSFFLQNNESKAVDYDYLTGHMNVRSEASDKSTVLGSLPIGSELSGERVGSWYKFNYKGKTAFVYGGYVVDELPSFVGYLRGISNIRDLNYNIITSKREGSKIDGKIIGNWIIFKMDGRQVKVWKPLLQTSRVKFKGFTKGIVNIRNAQNTLSDSIVREAKKGYFISGEITDNGNWIEFNNYGDKAYVNVYTLSKLSPSTKSTWITRGDYRYFITSDNEPLKGWRSLYGKIYYFDPQYCYMYKGVKSTGTNVHFFNSDGIVSSGTKTIYGRHHNQRVTFVYPTATERQNAWLNSSGGDFLQQAAINDSFNALGTKYYWYGTSYKTGIYCSGLPYRAYKNVGITIPGPEYGNLETAKKMGPQSGPIERGWGVAGDYGVRMVHAQYNLTDDYTGGKRVYWNNNYNLLKTGDLIFAKDKSFTKVDATHSALYAGKIGSKHFIIHTGFGGTFLEKAQVVPTVWTYPWKRYAQRPTAK